MNASPDRGCRPAADRASAFVLRRLPLLLEATARLPALDVACGDGRNGLLLAGGGARVLLVDRSEEVLSSLREPGCPHGAVFRAMDLEAPELPDFGEACFGAVLVFRFLHRPLVPALRRCLAPGGLFAYETYLEGQETLGRPRRPEHLLRRGELARWFDGWEIIEHFEGYEEEPPRFMGRMLCRKPSAAGQQAVASGRAS
ncbi:Tellurite methyltransferase [Fundidesulfovibrio magnetotacticus]|uniref:Tellurite methyltransferase n=1 Tax=Fundidesulfovibrio magnetotacticus TaxID=2730080 RepID=A0A6V8LW42_9BACT|nr:methyltransferase domain-containing protein [Fundidesulfovibrio magnetotacticus]GFK92485.1 Tellurite methyltransferase [Fundidesulfovibrio magnetotacticus]